MKRVRQPSLRAQQMNQQQAIHEEYLRQQGIAQAAAADTTAAPTQRPPPTAAPPPTANGAGKWEGRDTRGACVAAAGDGRAAPDRRAATGRPHGAHGGSAAAPQAAPMSDGGPAGSRGSADGDGGAQLHGAPASTARGAAKDGGHTHGTAAAAGALPSQSQPRRAVANRGAAAPATAAPASTGGSSSCTPAERARKDRLRRLRSFFSNACKSNEYSVEQIIGEGAAGVVCSALDHKTQRKVAVKRMQKGLDKPEMAKRILRELKFLRLLRGHENIVELHNILVPPLLHENKEVFAVFELLPADLSNVLRTMELSPLHIKCFMYQLLRGMYYLHSAGVFHRDIKPGNILVNKSCELRICDLGTFSVAGRWR